VAYVRRVWTVKMKLKTISETVNKDELFKKVNKEKTNLTGFLACAFVQVAPRATSPITL